MPRYELWSERECEGVVPDRLLKVAPMNQPISVAKAYFETLINKWEEEFDTYYSNDDSDHDSFESKALPGAEEGCNFVLKDEHGKSLFMYTHEWEVVK